MTCRCVDSWERGDLTVVPFLGTPLKERQISEAAGVG